MKRFISLGLSITVIVGLLILVNCQTKEVTSAKVYIQQDDWDKAIEQLEQAVKLYPNDPEAHFLLAQGYGKKGEFADMVREMEASLAVGPKFKPDIDNLQQRYWATSFNTGIKHHNDNNSEAALQSFGTSILIDSTRAEAYKNLAIVYANMDSVKKTAEVYELLIKHHPDDAQILRQLAQYQRELKNYDRAVEILKKALKLDPDDNAALSSLAITYDMKGDKEQAFKMYEEALAKDPENTDLMFNYGQLHFSNDNYDKAVALFEKVIAAKPDDYDSNLRVGYAYLGMSDEYLAGLKAREEKGEEITKEERDKLKKFFCDAIPYLEKCTQLLEGNQELSQDPSKVWHFLAVAYINCGFKEKGEAAFKKEDKLK